MLIWSNVACIYSSSNVLVSICVNKIAKCIRWFIKLFTQLLQSSDKYIYKVLQQAFPDSILWCYNKYFQLNISESNLCIGGSGPIMWSYQCWHGVCVGDGGLAVAVGPLHGRPPNRVRGGGRKRPVVVQHHRGNTNPCHVVQRPKLKPFL